MIILLGSLNPSKEKSLRLALDALSIQDYNILCNDSNSGVSSKPIGFEIMRGVENRNLESKQYAQKNNIDYDYLCALEGGFSYDENGLPFLSTYCTIEDNKGVKSSGKSSALRIRKDMFDYVKNGFSLNELLEEITKTTNYKESDGITGYLSNGYYKRYIFDRDAIISAFIPILYKDRRDELSKQIAIKKLHN